MTRITIEGRAPKWRLAGVPVPSRAGGATGKVLGAAKYVAVPDRRSVTPDMQAGCDVTIAGEMRKQVVPGIVLLVYPVKHDREACERCSPEFRAAQWKARDEREAEERQERVRQLITSEMAKPERHRQDVRWILAHGQGFAPPLPADDPVRLAAEAQLVAEEATESK